MRSPPTTRHDELVEEIADKILAYYDGCPVIAKEDREISRAIIALSPAGIPVGRKEGTFLEEAVRNLEAHRKRLEEWLDKKEISPTGTGEEE